MPVLHISDAMVTAHPMLLVRCCLAAEDTTAPSAGDLAERMRPKPPQLPLGFSAAIRTSEGKPQGYLEYIASCMHGEVRMDRIGAVQVSTTPVPSMMAVSCVPMPVHLLFHHRLHA